jgi:hypothetical protein
MTFGTSGAWGFLFGASGSGKTRGSALGTLEGVVLGLPTSLESLSRYGLELEEFDSKAGIYGQDENKISWINIGEIITQYPDKRPTHLLHHYIRRLLDAGVREILIDEYSLILQMTAAWLDSNGVAGWNKWNAIKADLVGPGELSLRQIMHTKLEAGVLLPITAHERAPKLDGTTNRTIRGGGPSVPGYDISEWFDGLATFSGQIHRDKTIDSGWPYIFDFTPDERFNRKIRHDVPVLRGPWHLGALRRACGDDMPYKNKFKWIPKGRERVEKALQDAGFPHQALDKEVYRKILQDLIKIPEVKGDTGRLRLLVDEASVYLRLTAVDPLDALAEDLLGAQFGVTE